MYTCGLTVLYLSGIIIIIYSHTWKRAHTLYRDNAIHICELDYKATSDAKNNPEINQSFNLYMAP